MASCTKVYMTRVRLKTRKAGRKRKNALANHGTTPSKAEFFGEADAVTAPAKAQKTPA